MTRHLARFATPALLGGLFFAFAGRAPAEEELSVQLYKKHVKSCVVIHAIETKKVGNGILTLTGRGSGSLIDAKKRLVLTNWHVVQELKKVWVDFPIYLKDGSMYQNPKTYKERAEKGTAIPATVLHRDKSRDLAIIQLERLPPGTVALALARKSPRNGETTWNIGSPTTGPGSAPILFSITEGEVRSVGPGAMIVGDSSGENAFEVKAMVVTAATRRTRRFRRPPV